MVSRLASRRQRGRHRFAHESLERRALLSAMPQGPEFRVNTFTTGNQFNSSVAADNNGNFVVVWQSAAQEAAGSSDGIFARRYNAAGVPQGDEFQVNQFTTGSQQTPTIAMDDDGDFVVAWNSAAQEGVGSEIWARRFDPTGTPTDNEFHVNTGTSGNQLVPAAAMDGAGNFVVTWISQLSSYDIYSRRYSASGVPLDAEEVLVNTSTGNSQINPAVAMDTDGDFVVVWQSFGQVGDDANGVRARRFNQAGLPMDAVEFQVNQYTTGSQRFASVGIDSTGNFVVAWESAQDGSEYGVYARRYSIAGAALGDEFRVNTATTNAQRAPAVAVDDSGDFVITWASELQDGANYGIYGQCYTAAGALDGAEFKVNTTTVDNQFNPAVAMDSDGDFVVTWQSNLQDGSGIGVYAQRFGAGGGGGAPSVVGSTFIWQNAPQRLEYGFNEDVSASLGPDDVVIENLTTGQTIPTANVTFSWNPVSFVGTFRFTGYNFGALPDGRYRATLLAAGVMANGQPLAMNDVELFQFLMADADQNGNVNLADFNRLAGNFGQSPRDFTQGDFNYDGMVNLADFNLLAGRFGNVLPAAAAAGAVAPGPFGAGGSRGGSSTRKDDRMIGVVDE